ncbi:F-actin-monooxygenase mical2b isoform X1 [Vespula maculifrons]|uniref:F-actin monooxygenase n=1 Tax=Vespula maculifrons TaxID=7453 RepID=A0ABD2CH61_VESMC
MDQQQQQSGKKHQTTANSPEAAIAGEVFDQFCNATTLKSILGHYRHLCELLKIKPNTINQFYPKLKSKLRSWKAQALWKKFDQRANHKCYNRGKACPNTRVLIIGGGPCGLRSAIEAQLLGAKVVVVEKRDRMSRNNVLHLWPFVIQDLRGLGAKKFFGKFCAGSIDHISIRQLQCILLKVALILGVEFHESVSFESLIPPPDNQEEAKIGWRAKTSPADHPVSQYEFDVLIGADGKRNTLEGFKRKEFRGKLAIAITANFINKRTEAEARVEEISGVAFIFNQKFFKELYQETGIDLENIVYYKDDTHYFVMTAKKHSLIDKGVILQDHADTAKLLAKENVDREALMLYAREAAEFSTEYQMMDMEFAVNHYGQPDVAMFDFTSMYAAENASRVLHHNGHRLLMILVGDSLLEPFWPTGSGCARGFLSSLDACWAIKGWGTSLTPLEVIAERESIYRLLGQTTPENLNRDYAAYTLDPHTRYPNLNSHSVTPAQVLSLVDTDDPEIIKQPAVQTEIDIPKKRRRRDLRADSQVHPDVLLRWLQKQVALYEGIHIEDMGASFKSGLAICAIIHRYRPDLIDFYSLQTTEAATNNQLAFDILEKELGIPPVMTGEEMSQCDVPDKLAMFSYLTQIYEVFRKEIPHIKHPKLEIDNEEISSHLILSHLTAEQKAQLLGHIVKQESATRTRHSRLRQSSENIQQHGDKKGDTISRRSRKRRSMEKIGATVEERLKRLDEIEKNRVEHMKRRQFLRKMATQQFYKSMQMLQANAKRERDEPFEDYSIFLYRQTAPDFKDRVKDLEQKILHPDRESKLHASHHRYGIDEEFSGRIKNIEHKLKGSGLPEKKPRDLLRAIGKIEKTDWNIKEIERKIEENKMGHGVRHDKVERVPKWSREQISICFIQFLARQIKMEKKGHDPKDADSKYAEIDNTLKNIDKKIKEGNVLGHNKVSAMAEQFSSKTQDTEPKVQKSNTKTPLTLPAQGGSEMCHFCNKRVYLMERLSAEGKYFHRGCFRCEYCSTSLRIGNHTYDRLKNGGRFYCTQHFGLPGTMKARIEKKKSTVNKENVANTSVNAIVPEKINIQTEGVVGLDLLDRGQTPERIEFENLARVSDTEEAHSQMDEDEWTDRNFGASAAEMGSSDDISDMSDSDDDNEVFEEAIDQPLTTEGTLELAKNWTLRYSNSQNAAGQSDTGSNEYEDSSDEYTSEEDESSTATEDEDDARARELRKQEVWLPVPPMSSDTDTGSETEVKIFQDSISTVNQDLFIFPESTFIHDPSITSPSITNIKSNKIESSKDDIIGSNIEKIEYINTVEPSMKIDGPTKKGVIDNGIDITNQTIYSHMDINKDFINDDNVLYNNSNNTDMNEKNTNTDLIIMDTSKIVDLSNESLTNQSLSTTESTHKIVSNNENLPDLIASSPKPSRQSSPSSLSDIGESIKEIFQDALMDIDVNNSIMKDYNNHKSILAKQDLIKTEISADNSSKSDSLKLSINSLEGATCPIVTVTSPSPTNEIPLEKLCADSTKLTIPTEVIKRPTSEHKNTAFDNLKHDLKHDLKQRRIKHATKLPELRPLSVENARFQMNKYFQGNINSNTKLDKKTTEKTAHNENISDTNDQMLDIKPKLSNKVDTKNIMKYFQITKSNSNNNNNNKSQISNSVMINTKMNNDMNVKNVKEEDKLDINTSVKEFSQINEEIEINDIDFNIKELPQINKQTEISDVDHLNLKEFSQINEQTELRDVEDYLFNDSILQSTITEKIEKIPTNNDSLKSSTNLSESVNVESTHIENESIDQNIQEDDDSHVNSDCHSNNLPALESLNNSETLCAEISNNEIDPLLKLNNMRISNNTDMSSHLNEIPKRPERKYSTHSNNNLSKNNILNTELPYTPEVPMRNKSSKAKISIAKESTIPSNMEAKSSKLDNLISPSNNRETTVQCGNSDMKKSNVQENFNRTEQIPVSVSNVASDDGSTEESEENSATEISTDSEFEHDGVTPTQHEIPEITINDAYVRKTRGNYVEPKKVQVKSKIISSINGKFKQEKDSEGKVDSGDLNPTKKTIQETKTESKSPMLGFNFNTNNLSPLVNPRKGDYLLNRTHSTEGIASKLSLELKKRYLLGGPALAGSVMKSGSTSNVDTKLRSLTDAISQHQKLLNPAPEPSPTMQAFLQGTSKLHLSNSQLSPLSPTMLFSSQSVRPLSVNQVSKINPNNDSYEHKAASGISDASKIHLPDLITETSILKSRTAPNVSESMKDVEKKQTEEKISPNKINDTNTRSSILENVNTQTTEKTHSTGLDENISCRPRSPLHETSIIVPEVHWVKNKEELKEADSTEDSEIDSDSLSLSDVEVEEDKGEQLLTANLSPPRLQIHSTDGDLLLDEGIEKNKVLDICSTFEPDSIECSFFRDEQSNNEQIATQLMQSSLNNDKLIEVLNNKIEECDLHDNNKQSISSCSSPASVASAISNKQDDSEENDVTTTAALTETEFSEWARDGQDLVSYDLQDTDFDINPEFVTKRKNSNLFHGGQSSVFNTTMMKRENPDDTQAYTYRSDRRTELPSNNTSELLANGENIDYMDTDNESLLDDSLQDATNTTLLKNRGYVEFVNIKTINSLRSNITDAPIATLECENDICSEEEIVNNENIIEINPVTMDDVMNKLNGATNSTDSKLQESSISIDAESRTVQEAQTISEAINNDSLQSMDEDSLLIVEPAEDTTTSEVITILASPVNPQKSIVPKEEVHEQIQQGKTLADSSNPDYLEYVKRLQSRIAEFSNAKDSIDVRKSKRKNSKNLAQTRTAELIAEEIRNQESFNNNNLNSPATSRKLEEITRERSKQKNVIEDLLMDKLVAHKQKSAEKKARRAARASSFSSVLSPVKLPTIAAAANNTSATKFVPTSLETQISNSHNMTFADAKKILQTEQSLPVDSNISSQKAENNESTSYKKSTNQTEQSENLASPKSHNEMDKDFKTPIAPPRCKHEEAKRTTEKARQDARERARLKSDEDLGLSPEDKIKELKMKFARRQHSVEERRKTEDIASPEVKSRSFSFTISKPGSKLQTSKSTDNMKAITKKMNLKDVSTISAKSMDELSKATNAPNSDNVTGGMKGETKKAKDPERRKSIIQAVSDFFFKKETSVSPQKDKLSMFRLTSKSKGKLYKSYSDGSDIDKVDSTKLKARPKSVCESMLIGNYLNENPPDIPPPPQDYINVTTHISDDSLSEDDTKTAALSTSQVQKATATEGSCNSISRKTKTMRKLTRQAQLKRLRMAQEIQRKLEETEVKQRELESRGVSVEKALRGEGDCSDREEADLLREWFDLMKERTELRRYEKELLVRAQEVQLEDRHERLQQELRERLADDDEKKTSADVEKEGEILTEMLEIVEKRDTLIALLEEERQRYQDEDRDLEAQMLAKGLRLIPMKKVGSKYSV